MVLTPLLVGPAAIGDIPGGWRLEMPASGPYVVAQLDDTRARRRRDFLHRPPLALRLEARASHPAPPGTLGFGFWNDPFPSLGGEAGASRRLPASPQAVWFFYAAPPTDLPFARGGAGSGWRAASLRTPRLPDPLVAAVGAAGFVGLSIPPLRRLLVRLAWRLVAGAQSDELPGLDGWHEYRLTWLAHRATFEVDGRLVLEAPRPPTGPLGLVVWIDNQWAMLSERTGMRFGVTPTKEPFWLEVRNATLNEAELAIATGDPSARPAGRDRALRNRRGAR